MQRFTWLQILGEQNEFSNKSSVIPVRAQIIAGLTTLAADLKGEWSLGTRAQVSTPGMLPRRGLLNYVSGTFRIVKE